MMKDRITVAILLAACIAAIAATRPTLFRTAQRVKENSSVYSLPPPSVIATASLGYRAAVADYLWAHVLVTQGLRMGEKRPFPEVAQYLDAINYLDPRFREPYRYTDSLLSLQINDPDRTSSVREARRIMERGIAEFPYDSELHLNFGLFLSYLAPGDLPAGSEERGQWQQAGAMALVRAGELSTNEAAAFKAMSAASLLRRVGKDDAAIGFLERLFAVTDNDEVREDISNRLRVLRQGRQASEHYVLSRAFDTLWRKHVPFAPRSWLSMLGPPTERWACAGPRIDRTQGTPCINDWPTWSAHVLRQDQTEP